MNDDPGRVVTAQDGDVISFDLSDAALICAPGPKGFAALALPRAAFEKANGLLSAVRKLESLGCDLSRARILGLRALLTRTDLPRELARAERIEREGLELHAFFYPASGRIRVKREAHQPKRTRVMIVDDSLTIRTMLHSILSADPSIDVVAAVEHPRDVLRMVAALKPDVITLDVHMPEMDGVTLLKLLMAQKPLPVVMISSIRIEEGPAILDALACGAVDYIQKPSMAEIKVVAPLIIDKIKAAATAQLQSIRPLPQGRAVRSPSHENAMAGSPRLVGSRLIALGASTGGTEALKDVLLSLPPQIPPIVIVQHIPAGFSLAFAQRLNDLCDFDVREAKHDDPVKPNQVLIAAGGKQMKLRREGSGFCVDVLDAPPVNRHRPSVDVLFESVARLIGRDAVAALLTGMGADGAQGLLQIKQAGGRTIAQDEASCIVYGMPREAALRGAAERILPLQKIGSQLIDWCKAAPPAAKRPA